MANQKVALLLEPSLPSPPLGDDAASVWLRGTFYPFLTNELRAIRFVSNNITSLNMSKHYEDGITTPGVANTTFTITHNLNRIPEIVIWNVDTVGAMIYDVSRASWTMTTLTLRCDQASVGLTVLVL